MPKSYTEEERNDIIKKLKEEANSLMQEKGVKKTTVDELVQRVGIPKGTFYLFYPSKEMLLFDCSQDYHEIVNKHISEGLKRIIFEKKIDVEKENAFTDCIDQITDVMLGGMKIVRNSCLKALLDPESMELVLSKLPEDVLEKHRKQEKPINREIGELISAKKELNIEELSGAFVMILLGGMYKSVVGESNMEGSMRLLVKGLVMQIFG